MQVPKVNIQTSISSITKSLAAQIPARGSIHITHSKSASPFTDPTSIASSHGSSSASAVKSWAAAMGNPEHADDGMSSFIHSSPFFWLISTCRPSDDVILNGQLTTLYVNLYAVRTTDIFAVTWTLLYFNAL